MSNMKTRLSMYFIGLFVMTLGVALSVKSDLGVSPVSSIPYTITCVWGMEMGRATVVFHMALVLLQMLLLRRAFQLKSLLQVAVGVVFGAFTSLCNYAVGLLPTPDLLPFRLAMMLASTVIIALGIFLYVPADVMPLAGEGAMKTISDLTGVAFPRVKIAFDVSMVVISLTTCLLLIHSPGSVGLGTVIAAVLLGVMLSQITRLLGPWRDRLLHPECRSSLPDEDGAALTH